MSVEPLLNKWEIKRLGELSSAIQYGYTAKATTERLGPQLLRITDIQNDAVDWDAVPFCEISTKEIEKYRLGKNDLLFARTGATVGKSYLIPGEIPESVFASYLIRVRLLDEVYPRYVAYFFRSGDYWRQITETQAGIGQPNVNGTKLAQIKIPVAPLKQQKLIVTEIEKQFSRLDEAVANLKRVKANLKRYKASVLKSAVEGKLTEYWRKQHPNVEPASKLLERILTDRRGKWTDKGKYKEPSALEVIDFPSLPKGWTWASLDQLSWDSSYGTSVKCSYNNSGPAVLRIPNIASGKLDLRDLKFAPDSYEVGRGDKLSAGDLLIIRTNGSRNLIGRSAVVRQPLPSASAFASYLIRFRLAQQLEIIKWLSAIWDAEHFRVWIEKRASTSAGQHNISMSVLARLPVPLPPLAEQDQIVSEVECRLSVIDALEAAIQANLTRADRLRQSILSEAFSGRLVKERSNNHLSAIAT